MQREYASYDASSLASILKYAKRLEGSTLRESCDNPELDNPTRRKGSFGNAVEQYYFRYRINSDAEPDFGDVDTELKTTPLRCKKNASSSA